jgi:hypothetical protein
MVATQKLQSFKRWQQSSSLAAKVCKPLSIAGLLQGAVLCELCGFMHWLRLHGTWTAVSASYCQGDEQAIFRPALQNVQTP